MNYYKRYLILSLLGALIIGMAFYLFMNNYLDRKEILVLTRDIETGETVVEEDLCFKEFYKNSLPESYLENKIEAIGKKINIDRKKDDYISLEMFSLDKSKNIMENLSEGEVLVAVNIDYLEPVTEEIKVGSHISIISTEIDRDLLILEDSMSSQKQYGYSNSEAYTKNKVEDISLSDVEEEKIYKGDMDTDGDKNLSYRNENINSGDYLDNKSFMLSENIVLISGQLIVRNLEIVGIKKSSGVSKNILINEGTEMVSLYIKCGLKEASIVARLTRDDSYKIILENL